MFFNSPIKNMNMSEAVEEMKKNPKIKLIDVRSLEEYEEGHLPNSRNFPLSNLERIQHTVAVDDTVYVYCASGMRSKQACKWLMKAGYVDVYNLGGIMNYHGEISKPFQ